MPTSIADWICGRDYEIIPLDDRESLLFLAANHRVLRVASDLGRRLRSGLASMTDEEASEWQGLEDAGYLAADNVRAVRESEFDDGANLAINVNLTSFCNLGCTYCFADGGDYGRITGRMQSGTVDGIFEFIAKHVTPTQTVRFEFFGGEPLLNLDRIVEVCERAEEFERTHGIRFLHRISTNLTVLPPRAVELFARKTFIVSVSIDGGEATHDRNRPTKSGEGSFQSIVENCRTVRAASDDIVMVARMTVVGGAETLVENVRELWNLNIFDYFQIYPGVVPAELGDAVLAPATPPLVQLDCDGSGPDDPGEAVESSCGSRSPGSAMYPGFLAEQAEFAALYADFFQPGNRFRGVLEFERIVEMVHEGKAALGFCSAGRNYFTFSPDDSIMPCHRLVGELEFQVGAADGGLTTDLTTWRSPMDTHPVCSQCWVRYICAGGCKQENFIGTGDLNEPNPEGCDYQRQLVARVVATMAGQDDEYFATDRGPLDNLFVSCGRPVVTSRGPTVATHQESQHFRPLLSH